MVGKQNLQLQRIRKMKTMPLLVKAAVVGESDVMTVTAAVVAPLIGTPKAVVVSAGEVVKWAGVVVPFLVVEV